MRNVSVILLVILLFNSCVEKKAELISPDGSISVVVSINNNGLFYTVKNTDREVICPSALGVELNDSSILGKDVRIIATESKRVNETWEQVWGEERLVKNNYNELLVRMQETTGQNHFFNIRFRVFNDGVGFRYEFPKQEGFTDFVIMKENTEFNIAQDTESWSLSSPAYGPRYYESLYRKQKISTIKDTVTTPVVIEYNDGLHIAIHEAALVDYAKMNLYVKEGTKFKAELTPWSTGEKVFASAPFNTPWRTIVLAANAAELITSRLMLNLNEPNRIEQPDFIKPEKYIGIWWGMHMNLYTWKQGAKHGATTENVKRYIDFASKNKISGVLVEGWNVGWNGIWEKNGNLFRFAEPFNDFDIDELSKYAGKRGVKIIGHNETSGSTINYENQLEEALSFCNKYDITTIKTGYVSPYLDGKELHDSQYGVRHMQKVVETAAKHRICIVNHEPVMPTGICRTWPNLLSQEGMRGQEWNAWSDDGGNPPSHTVILPFTRGLAGPMDFTPGIFNFNNSAKPNTRVHTTLAKQLALYVVLYSPVQMAADLIENYENNDSVFQFIRDVAVDWEKTLVPHAKIGEYIVTIRQARNSDEWFLGAITNEEGREMQVKLDFLKDKKVYTAEIYADADATDWKTNPTAIAIRKEKVNQGMILNLLLKGSGGTAIRFVPVD